MSIIRALSRQLARDAERFCRHYLSGGHREGHYWIVGDTCGSAGRSLYVRLRGPDHGRGAAGKWTDAATGDHGDLLDLLGRHCGHLRLADTLEEARRFLSLPRDVAVRAQTPAQTGSPEAARRLFGASGPIAATLAERYLFTRGISGIRAEPWLRFHPGCWYRRDRDDRPSVPAAMPAMIAAVTDLEGTITGVHRTWLDPDGCSKAKVAVPASRDG